MGQVPMRYGILGDGRVARHFSHYFTLEKIPFSSWARRGAQLSLAETFKDCETILLLVSDRAIEAVVDENPFLSKRRLVHFSGSHVSERAAGLHPLMSFSTELYPLETYQETPFIVEDGVSFLEIFPTLTNRHFKIKKDDKAFYHALCVLGGNGSAILWSKLIDTLSRRFDLPQDVAFPFLDQVTKNLKNSGHAAVTGPLSRGDQQTIEKNLRSLKGDPFERVYSALAQAYKETAQ